MIKGCVVGPKKRVITLRKVIESLLQMHVTYLNFKAFEGMTTKELIMKKSYFYSMIIKMIGLIDAFLLLISTNFIRISLLI